VGDAAVVTAELERVIFSTIRQIRAVDRIFRRLRSVNILFRVYIYINIYSVFTRRNYMASYRP